MEPPPSHSKLPPNLNLNDRLQNIMCTIWVPQFEPYNHPDWATAYLPDFSLIDRLDRVYLQFEQGKVSNNWHWQIFMIFKPKEPKRLGDLFKDMKKQKCHLGIDRDYMNKKGRHVNAGINYVNKKGGIKRMKGRRREVPNSTWTLMLWESTDTGESGWDYLEWRSKFPRSTTPVEFSYIPTGNLRSWKGNWEADKETLCKVLAQNIRSCQAYIQRGMTSPEFQLETARASDKTKSVSENIKII